MRFLSLIALCLSIVGTTKSQCVVADTLIISPPIDSLPILGSGTLVTVEYEITGWNSASSNWLHGVQFEFSPEFALSTLTPLETPEACSAGSGIWGWYDTVTGMASGLTWGPGYFFDSNSGGPPIDSLPGNNFGDNCTVDTFSRTYKDSYAFKVASGCSTGFSNFSAPITWTMPPMRVSGDVRLPFPNPALDRIQWDVGLEAHETTRLIRMDGSTVQSVLYQNASMNLAEVPAGIYLLMFEGTAAPKEVHRVVVAD